MYFTKDTVRSTGNSVVCAVRRAHSRGRWHAIAYTRSTYHTRSIGVTRHSIAGSPTELQPQQLARSYGLTWSPLGRTMLGLLVLASASTVAASGVCTAASPCLTLNNGIVRLMPHPLYNL